MEKYQLYELPKAVKMFIDLKYNKNDRYRTQYKKMIDSLLTINDNGQCRYTKIKQISMGTNHNVIFIIIVNIKNGDKNVFIYIDVSDKLWDILYKLKEIRPLLTTDFVPNI